MSTDEEVIFSYTRAEALEGGVLIDVSKMASEAGIKYPTAVTRAVWVKYIEVPEGVECQDEVGRLWDVVWMLRHAIGKVKGPSSEVLFQLYVRNDNRRPKLVTLKALCGPGDDLSPCITVLLPDED